MSLAEIKRRTNPFSAFNLVIALSALVLVLELAATR
jgi:hypothetical protein